MTLVMLRTGTSEECVAWDFQIGVGTCSQYFTTWVRALLVFFEYVFPVPTLTDLKPTYPEKFHPNVHHIIDATEIFMETPSDPAAHTAVWSDYKHFTTVKFLVSISPSGVIIWISDGFPGSITDIEIVQFSGFLKHVHPRDIVMADKGFPIQHILSYRLAQLRAPTWKRKGQTQFTYQEDFKSSRVSKERIHVERAMGRLKDFRILRNLVTIQRLDIISAIFKVCGFLCNFDKPLMSKENAPTIQTPSATAVPVTQLNLARTNTKASKQKTRRQSLSGLNF